jgi:Holliday junction resolvase RusA-like endonuclease
LSVPDRTFEFTVEGPPVSPQAHNRPKLKAFGRRVRAAAQRRWDGRRRPWNAPVILTAVYYHDGLSVRRDLDNAIKPIQDALNGLVYEDDSLITRARLSKRSLDRPYVFRNAPQAIADAFVAGREFIYIKVECRPEGPELL